jgi:hypothetical protein
VCQVMRHKLLHPCKYSWLSRPLIKCRPWMIDALVNEEDDNIYDDTNDRYHTLLEQSQETLDVISDLYKTISQLEIYIDAFFLGSPGEDQVSS